VIERARALAAHAGVTTRSPPSATPAPAGEPADLAALHAVADGLELADGTRILPRAEIGPATAWLVGEKSLEWGPDLWVIGERDDLVLVRDLDAGGARSGGGVIETATDGLSTLKRASLDVLGYLEERLGIPGEPAPERAAREAVVRRDPDAIARAIARGFYPGAERELAHASLILGGLRAGAGDPAGAMDAFTRSVAARASAVPRGAETGEARAAWRACAVTAEKAGAREVAEACRARALAPA
jgi:hypothetical protein